MTHELLSCRDRADIYRGIKYGRPLDTIELVLDNGTRENNRKRSNIPTETRSERSI